MKVDLLWIHRKIPRPTARINRLSCEVLCRLLESQHFEAHRVECALRQDLRQCCQEFRVFSYPVPHPRTAGCQAVMNGDRHYVRGTAAFLHLVPTLTNSPDHRSITLLTVSRQATDHHVQVTQRLVDRRSRNRSWLNR